jgi:hypothetical protein
MEQRGGPVVKALRAFLTAIGYTIALAAIGAIGSLGYFFAWLGTAVMRSMTTCLTWLDR